MTNKSVPFLWRHVEEKPDSAGVTGSPETAPRDDHQEEDVVRVYYVSA